MRTQGACRRVDVDRERVLVAELAGHDEVLAGLARFRREQLDQATAADRVAADHRAGAARLQEQTEAYRQRHDVDSLQAELSDLVEARMRQEQRQRRREQVDELMADHRPRRIP